MTVSIAVIWGHHRQDAPWSTHHQYWEAAIRERSDLALTRYTWSEWPQMPRTHDLYFFIDYHPSLFRVDRRYLRNTAFYWWDSYHLSQAFVLQMAGLFDRSYFAERVAATTARQYGLPVTWLPPAFHPGVFRPLPGQRKVHQYAFIGQMDAEIYRSGDTKHSFMLKLAQSQKFHGFMGRGIYGHDANAVYNEADVLFERTIFSTIGTRFFELIGSGGFVLMNRLQAPSGLEFLAADGIHYASYDDTYEDFEHKLEHYLTHPQERERIVQTAQDHFLRNHTYGHRLNHILRDFGLTDTQQPGS